VACSSYAPAAEQIRAHLAAVPLVPGVERLQVHGLPEGPRLDVLRRERLDDPIAGHAAPPLVEEEAGEPVGVQAVGRLRHERERRDVGERVAVPEGDLTTLLHPPIEHLELPAADPRQHVGEAVVVADLRVVVGDPSSRAWVDQNRAFSTQSLRRAASIPPPVVVTILLPLKEKAPTSPIEPAGLPL
jgi:hypothetical protein